jgi:hypothetical protein
MVSRIPEIGFKKNPTIPYNPPVKNPTIPPSYALNKIIYKIISFN